MRTSEQCIVISQSIWAGASLSHIVALLQSAGIKGYSYHVASGDIGFYDARDEKVLLPGSLSFHQNVVKQQNRKRFFNALRQHQAGGMDFPSFCLEAAASGVNLWVVDLTHMTVSYFGMNGCLMLERPLLPARNGLLSEMCNAFPIN